MKWQRVFLTGLGLWLLTVVVTFATGNPNLIPTIVLLGSFLVPVTFVVWASGRRHSSEVTSERLFSTFVTGGVLGVLAASLLEAYLLHPSPVFYLGVGLIEEAAKLAALVFLTRRLQHRYAIDGVILGASVGFGFAAFESAGYAFTALFTQQGLSLTTLVETELLRGVLTPVGHGLWTAILGGVLFATAAKSSRRRVFAAYLGVAVLHALWDGMDGIARVVTLVLAGNETTAAQAHLFTIISWGGLILSSLIGVAWLIGVRHRAARLEAAGLGSGVQGASGLGSGGQGAVGPGVGRVETGPLETRRMEAGRR
ncbi:PrsW family glutamic-type intramembrane protease [Actinoplanes sp. NPDC051861]|uniref:PrsW family intramembrane metalloprotease n=1 Tax=Actinoplanes sp. NPDC051861 TaxID=3155170 RepID=UPI0034215A72